MKKPIILILLWILFVTCYIAWGERCYTPKELCDCIYIIEGKERANQPYGINPKYWKCYTKKECERICLATVRNNKERFKNQNKEKDFLKFLAKRYCPYNWEIWLRNLKFYLRKYNNYEKES